MARLPSSSLPQADVLPDVVRVVEAVGKGSETYQEIAQYLGKVERQGRYYRLAAELIGLIGNDHNQAFLTAAGERYLALDRGQREIMLRTQVLNTRLFQRIVPFLEMHPQGVTRAQMEAFIENVVDDVGPTMIGRRAWTVLSWLLYLGVVTEEEGRYRIRAAAFTTPQMTTDPAEPLVPRAPDLAVYRTVAERANAAQRTITATIDEVRIERAANAHIRLVNLVAARLTRAGMVPRSSVLIDLATATAAKPAIFEMKSVTDANARDQVRRAVSQLYEYRYLQDAPTADLVLVLERELPASLQWMSNYLECDRGIKVIWDGDDQLHASPETRQALPYLWPGR